MSSQTVLNFGPFSVLPARRVLLEDGQPLRLGSRAFDLLVVLCERAGEIVSHPELLSLVWPNRVVEDGSLRVHIAALRKALGDGQQGRRYISNVPLRGYCFVAPVRRDEGDAGPAPAIQASTGPPPPAPGLPLILPLPLTRIVGREDAIAELRQRLPLRRCVTLVGPGGIGKTSVALAAARELAEQQGYEVVLVELGALGDEALVPQALASALGIVAPAAEPIGTLCAYLRDKSRLLLVLDNCEHLVGAAAQLAEQVLRHAPGVHVLATSREALRIHGEWVQRLASLRLPPAAVPQSATEALTYASVQLFVERAAAVVDGFELSDANSHGVCEVCRGLDGIPLAIELAASAVDIMGVAGLVERLGGRLLLLNRGRRTALPRHQTLRATLDWSFELLSLPEQQMLARLSVFRSAFSRAAALAVSGQEAHGSQEAVDEALTGLVAKSLLVADVHGEFVHYRLLETTREYAAERLAASGEAAELAARHARCMLDLLREAEAQRNGQISAHWLLMHARSVDDLRAAVVWAFSAQGDTCLGVSLMAWSAPLWFALSLMAEYRSLAEQALARIDAAPPEGPHAEPEDTMRLCEALGHALWHTRGGGPAMAASFTRALHIAETLQATPYRLRCIWGLWLICNTVGDYAGSRRLAEEFGDIVAAAPESGAQLTHERMMSLGLHYHGDQRRAREHAQRVLEHPLTINHTARNSGFQFDQRVAALTVLARILWLQGFPDQALQRAHEAVEEALSIGHALSLCYAIANGAAPVAFWAGDIAAARRFTDLLQQRADERSLYFWQAFGGGYRLLLDFLDTNGQVLSRRALLHPAMAALLRETLCTVQPALADDDILSRAIQGDAGWCTPELLRIQGERVLAGGGSDEAERLFERGIDVARQQGALSWELRCTGSLARLWAARGQRSRARERLAGVLGQFSEGDATADLQQVSAWCAAWSA